MRKRVKSMSPSDSRTPRYPLLLTVRIDIVGIGVEAIVDRGFSAPVVAESVAVMGSYYHSFMELQRR